MGKGKIDYILCILRIVQYCIICDLEKKKDVVRACARATFLVNVIISGLEKNVVCNVYELM